MSEHEQMILDLYDIGAVKFGNFTLKSGIESPYYVSLRLLVSHPACLQRVADLMWEKVKDCDFDIVCGVPYTALPMATAISLKHNIPMVMRRREMKDYGIRKAIEGDYQAGQRCLVIEDLVTSGSSVLETIEPLQHADLPVRDVVVLLDRQQGAEAVLRDRGYTLHAVVKVENMLDTLLANNRIDQSMAEKVRTFILENSFAKS